MTGIAEQAWELVSRLWRLMSDIFALVSPTSTVIDYLDGNPGAALGGVVIILALCYGFWNRHEFQGHDHQVQRKGWLDFGTLFLGLAFLICSPRQTTTYPAMPHVEPLQCADMTTGCIEPPVMVSKLLWDLEHH
ncbi:hypothetical protein BDU57DRAFT_543594 [Ampelomyces quisqualis]|uniref:Uncharacterized protein n=1 Tax=Ampelomyces quisqualis TaxID=50730 RepID=A0A6A5Q8N1_AMPQU|nr:hypothetical protein BDU57DRAFT_543594 [Ampelomyces quisqualis]